MSKFVVLVARARRWRTEKDSTWRVEDGGLYAYYQLTLAMCVLRELPHSRYGHATASGAGGAPSSSSASDR